MKFIEIGNQKWSTQNSTIKSFSNGEKFIIVRIKKTDKLGEQ